MFPSHRLAHFRCESRSLLKLFFPLVITQVATSAMTVIDTVMAGQASSVDLAALAVGGSVWVPILLFLRGILMVLTPVIAHHYGAGAKACMTRDLIQGLVIAVGVSAAVIPVLWLGEAILHWMKVASAIIPVAGGYLKALALGLPAMAIFFAMSSLCEGIGDTRTPMRIALLGLLLNIPLNYIFIYGKFSLPAMGAVGCGWATSLCYVAMSVVLAYYLRSHRRYRELLRTGSATVIPARIVEILGLGGPVGIALFMEGSIFTTVSLFIGQLGVGLVAAHQVALSFTGLLFVVPLSLSFGVTIRVGQALGAGGYEEAISRTVVGITLSIFWGVAAALLILLFPTVIIGLYSNDPVVIRSAAPLLVYAAIYQVSDALQVSANGALRGYKDTRVPMVLIGIAYWVIALPLGYILGMTNLLTPAMGPSGFWVGLISGLTVAAVLLSARLLWIIRKTGASVSH